MELDQYRTKGRFKRFQTFAPNFQISVPNIWKPSRLILNMTGIFQKERPVRQTQHSLHDCVHYTPHTAQFRQLVEAVLLHPVHASEQLPAPHVFHVRVPIQASRLMDGLPRLGCKALNDSRCDDSQHQHNCRCCLELLEDIPPSTCPWAKRATRLCRRAALSTVGHDPNTTLADFLW